jgi:hypothetical protein
MSDADRRPFDPYHIWLQIPNDARPPTHFQLLGLNPGEDDPEVIRQANLMRSAHVRNFQKGEHGDAATRILEELANAGRVLLDPTLRAAYYSTIKASEPVAKVVHMPIPLAAVTPVAVASRIGVVEERPVAAERRTKTKRRQAKSRQRRTVVFLAVVFVVGIGVTVYIASNPLSQRPTASVEDGAQSRDDLPIKPAAPVPEIGPEQPEVKVAARPRAPELVAVRLTVDPPNVRLSIESQESAAVPKSTIEGEGDARRVVAERGTLPLVVVASAPGYKPLRVTVVANDVGRIVPVLLNRETLPDPLAAAGDLPAPWRDKGKRTQYRMVADFRFLLPVSSANQSPVWRYTFQRPEDDWAAWGFDDSRWAQGPAAFATALGDEFKVRTGKKGDLESAAFGRTLWTTPELWLRTAIDLPDGIRLGHIRWNYRCDDSITVYVNGRQEFAETRATWRAQRITNPEHFLPGRNVIAVHAVNRAGPGLVDVGFEWLAIEEVR